MRKIMRIICGILSLCVMLEAMPLTALATDVPFDDVAETAWYHEAVAYVYEIGLTSGTGIKTFSPDVTTTRGMIVTILHRLEGTPSANSTVFSDVASGKWYSEAVNWASSKDIVNGYGNGKFGPEDTITREQMAAILYRYARYKGYDVSASTSLSKYTDASQISSYAVESMVWANAAELITGTTNTTLSPKGSATRAQVAVILMRFCNNIRQQIDWTELNENYSPSEDSIIYDGGEHIYYLNNILLVVFDTNATDQQIESAVNSVSGDIVGRIDDLDMYEIKVAPSSLNALEALASSLMSNYSFVTYATYESATPDAEDVAITPNDPWNGDTGNGDWSDNDVDGSNWWIEATDAQYAWEYNGRFSQINIGISDSSFDIGHEDLKNKYVFPNEITSFRNQTVFTSVNISKEPHYHGTHVAGIIGAEANNRKGITGLSWNSRLLLAPTYTRDAGGNNVMLDATVYANLTYLVTAGAKVINYSMGKSGGLTSANSSYSNDFLKREGDLAATFMAKLLDQGYDFVIIQSAGNGRDDGVAVDARQNGLFASITKNSITCSNKTNITDVLNRVIIVGAAEQSGNGYRCTSFSNFGSQVSICAPGRNIYSTVPGDTFWGFELSGGYTELSGTSMAAPIVTGICAMVWSTDQSMSGSKVKELVCQNTNTRVNPNPNSASSQSYNMVNARLAVEAALGINQGQINYYEVLNNGISSWDAAEEYCESLGGHLATLTSREENDHVFQIMRDSGYTSAYFGLTDKDNEGTWVWVTGEPVSYTNWHSGEPNHENSNEDYAMFYFKYSDGTWNDGDFGGRTVSGGTAFICGWDTEEAYNSYLESQKSAYSYSDLLNELKDDYGTASSEQFVSSMGPSDENYPNEIFGYISSQEVDLDSDGTNELIVFRSISGADAIQHGAQNGWPRILTEVYQIKNNQAVLCSSKLIGGIFYCEGSDYYLFYSKQLGRYCIIYDYGTWGSFTGFNSNGAIAYTVTTSAINQIGDWGSAAINFWEGDDVDAELLAIGAPYAEYSATIDNRSGDTSFKMMVQILHDGFGISPEEAAKYNNGRSLAHTLQIVAG